MPWLGHRSWAAWLCIAFACQAVLAGEPTAESRQTADRNRAKLDELARWCDQHQLAEQARQTRQWPVAADPWRLVFYDLPVTVGTLTAASVGGADAAEWQRRFAELRQARADELFESARAAVRGQRVSLAYDLVTAALRENPDHAAARKLLGYQAFERQWLTPYAIAKQRSGQVWHERFGWLSQKHVDRYEAGERMNRGRWISAEHDARLHAQIDTGWEVETERFVVTTNHSLEAAAQYAARLERLADVWERMFPAYTTPQAELAKLFDGGTRTVRARKRHQVTVFRNQEEYRRALKGEIPDDVHTTGIYLGSRRTAYFFVADSQPAAAEASPAPDDGTLYHEAVHQLFSESRSVPPDIGRAANFWIIEGVACYFETFSRGDGRCTVGGPDALRLQAARQRALSDRFYVPLAELTKLGMSQLQRDPRIARLYTQSAGLTHFLIHDDGGRYRDALVAYLLAVYSGRDRASTLSETTGTTYQELDRQYHQFLQAPP